MSEMKDRLKQLRKTLGLKQREIAEKLGVGVGLVGQWESGVSAVGHARLYQLCNEFHVSRTWLLTGAGEMFEERGEKKLSEFTDDEIYTESMRRLFDKLPDAAKLAVQRFAESLW